VTRVASKPRGAVVGRRRGGPCNDGTDASTAAGDRWKPGGVPASFCGLGFSEENGGGGSADGAVGVEVEALEVGVARAARGDPWGIGIAAEAEHGRAGASAEHATPHDRRAAERRERGRVCDHRVGGRVDLLLGQQAAAPATSNS